MNETLTTRSEKADPSIEASQPSERHESTACPECEGAVRPDDERGEHVCEACGLVLDERAIDRGPEWRTYEAGEADEQSRVGLPVTELMHDRGLSTTIDWRNRDSQGNPLPTRKRARLQRLRTWNQRFSTKDASERNLKQAFGELVRMAAALGLPEPCRETAGVIYRQAVDEGLLPGRSIEAMASASLYAAARRHGSPRTFEAVAAVSRVEKLDIQRGYRYLSRELALALEPTDPVQYLPQYGSALGVSDDAERLAREVLDTAKAQEVHIGKNPAGLAAAALYAAARLANDEVTQHEVCAVANISEVTIRKRYPELLDVYGEHRD